MMGEGQTPPVSNRGVQKPNHSDLIASVDWCQVTFKLHSFDEVAENYLHLKSKFFKPSNVKFFNYDFCWVFNNIYILCNKDYEHYHVLMSGGACRAFENYLESDNYSWEMFFKDIFKKSESVKTDEGNKEIKFTRLDICIDDRKVYLDIPTLWRKIKAGEIVSKFKMGRSIESVSLSDGSDKGQTIYFGSDSSAVKFRFYEKNYEQAYKKNLDVEMIGAWNRYEVQMRDEQATNAARQIAENDSIDFVVKGVMFSYVRFLIDKRWWKGEKPRKSRQETYKPYMSMLEGAEKLKITNDPQVKTINDKREWARNQLATTLAMIEISNEIALEYDLNNEKSYFDEILSNSKIDDNGRDLIFSHLIHLFEKKEGKKIEGDKLQALHKSLSSSINKKYGDMK